MGKFGKKLAKFANSPKGQKLKDKAMRKAKDPKTRAKLEKKFGARSSRREPNAAASTGSPAGPSRVAALRRRPDRPRRE